MSNLPCWRRGVRPSPRESLKRVAWPGGRTACHASERRGRTPSRKDSTTGVMHRAKEKGCIWCKEV